MRAALVLLPFFVATRAYADPAAIALSNDVPAGKKPSLTITANQPITLVQLDIDRLDDQKSFHYKAGPLRIGQKAELAVGDGKSGHARWKGHLTLRGAWGESGNEVTFESQVGGAGSGGVHVTYDRAHLDLDKGILQFQVTKPIASAQLTVVADDGSEIANNEQQIVGAPGRWLAMSWTPSGKNVLRLELKVTTAGGDATTVKLVPWSVAVAHEELVFPSGQSAILPSENAKLEASYNKIVDAIEKVRKNEPSLDVRVFIAGHTDTVGGSDDNRKLSQARARSIAAWFRDHGLPMPVFYAGFGEDQLKVKTPDNTDEPRNRRADYVIAAEAPPGHYVELK